MYPVSEAFLQAVQGNTREVLLDRKDHNCCRSRVSVYAGGYRQRQRLYHSPVLR